MDFSLSTFKSAYLAMLIFGGNTRKTQQQTNKKKKTKKKNAFFTGTIVFTKFSTVLLRGCVSVVYQTNKH